MILQDYFQLFRSYWVVIIVFMFFGGGVVYGYFQFVDLEYCVEVQVMVILMCGESMSELLQGLNYVQSFVQIYMFFVVLLIVFDLVIEEVGLDEMLNWFVCWVDVNVLFNIVVIEIGVIDMSGESVQEIVNVIVSEFVVVVGNVFLFGVDEKLVVCIEMILFVWMFIVLIFLNMCNNVVFGVVVGFVVGVVFVILCWCFVMRVVIVGVFEEIIEVFVFGEIFEVVDNQILVCIICVQLDGCVVEVMCQVLVSLKFVDVDKNCWVILVILCLVQEGKLLVGFGFVLMLVEGGCFVLFIEVDLCWFSIV